MYTKNLLALLRILSYAIIFSSTLQQCGSQLLPPLPPLLPPLPLIPGLINFLDERISMLLPIVQNFKNTIISDPLGITQSWVGPNICNYTGFYCDNPVDNRTATTLASLDFNGFQLSAPSLDGFIDQLPDLAIFHANTNNFTGTVPAKMANLKYLYELDLSNNKLSGPFPASVLSIMDLSFLDLRFNSLSGPVPPQIFAKRLDALFLNNNDFAQKLPDNLGSTPAAFLTFANNKFTGPIPRSIGNASETLLEVLFLNNQLSGCIPYEIGLLRKATVIDVGGNMLTGPLPGSLGCLEMAELLNFAGNLLYGQVPEAVCGLGNLKNLTLSYNYFSNVGPNCRKLITNGTLDVRQNCIPGLPNQRSAAECAAFSRNRGQQQCPNYNRISCGHHNSDRTASHTKQKSGRHLITYSALLRHRLL